GEGALPDQARSGGGCPLGRALAAGDCRGPCRSPGGTDMSQLITTPNIPDTDGFYAGLLAAHRGLTEAESHALNARLVLVLANHIGDRKVLEQALALARDGAPEATAQAGG